MEVQVRCNGDLTFFNTVIAAYNAFKNDSELEKISFDDDEWIDGKQCNQSHRFRAKLKKEVWNPKSEQRMNELSETYRLASSDTFFLVDQQMTVFCDLISSKVCQETVLHLKQNGYIVPDVLLNLSNEYPPLDEDSCYALSIVSVLSGQEFESKYKNK